MHVIALFGWSWTSHLQWDPQIRGLLFTGIATTLLIGSVWLLLSTNVGIRMGLLLTLAGLFGWLMLLTGIWTVYALKQGPPNPSSVEATWVAKEIIQSPDPGSSMKEVLNQAGYSATIDFAKTNGKANGWQTLPKTAKDYADAASKTDNVLAPAAPLPGVKANPLPVTWNGKSPYTDSTQYLVIAAYSKGGETYWPFNIGVRRSEDGRNKGFDEIKCTTAAGAKNSLCKDKKVKKFDCADGTEAACAHDTYGYMERAYNRITKGFLHKPHYVVVQVQGVRYALADKNKPLGYVTHADGTPVLVDPNNLALGQVAKPIVDPSKPIVTVTMIRKLGQQRIYPFMWFVSNAIVFGLITRALHKRDQQVWAQRAAAATA